ncbi:helix-turn-helix domain-containing protein [Saccharopolyspora sp. K220]|uniref:helix-turn-helix domain-containing protein n=1 Tax=Saccharopolyspora soli TaxID=2926618 RepID=UPI001F59E6A6|nr:helix-turn-helix domain-containing protein [Saccharopolyspora soli]MCI2421556.1 helix-turn-helix domain-containing protein [Saccharopolyspora soli]
MLRVEEAARRLAVSRTVAYRLIKSGDLESVMIGQSRRVPTDALDKYVRGLRGQAT